MNDAFELARLRLGRVTGASAAPLKMVMLEESLMLERTECEDDMFGFFKAEEPATRLDVVGCCLKAEVEEPVGLCLEDGAGSA